METNGMHPPISFSPIVKGLMIVTTTPSPIGAEPLDIMDNLTFPGFSMPLMSRRRYLQNPNVTKFPVMPKKDDPTQNVVYYQVVSLG